MIVPSIDLRNGHAVQLVGGKEQALDAGDPRPIAAHMSLAGELAIVDLDAALGTGSNRELIAELLRTTPARVGGGVRDVDTARWYLDAGATKVVIGTRATPELLSALPRERVCVALDAIEGEVVVDGWRTKTGASVEARMAELSPYASSFLVTFVEREGRLGGTDLAKARTLVDAAAGAEVVIAGGVTTTDEVALLDAMGAHAQVGMALYTGTLDLADALVAPIARRLPEQPWPTVVVDEGGVALGLCYSSARSVREAVRTRRGVYQSRRRGLWVKGETSGATQDLLRVDLDCDRDTLRFTVRQHGAGFCHQRTRTCFGSALGVRALEETLRQRRVEAPPGSYAARLFHEEGLLEAKLVEEAGEVARATTAAEVTDEAADLLFFLIAKLAHSGCSLADVERVLDRRGRKVTRRPGDRKPTEERPS